MSHAKISSKPKNYEYQILVNRKVIWRGQDPKNEFHEISKKYPKDKIGIRFVPKEGVLIAEVNL